MQRDALIAAAQIDYYAGLATEVKGETLPMGEGILNYTPARALWRVRPHRGL